jgi:hypothetical protein
VLATRPIHSPSSTPKPGTFATLALAHPSLNVREIELSLFRRHCGCFRKNLVNDSLLDFSLEICDGLNFILDFLPFRRLCHKKLSKLVSFIPDPESLLQHPFPKS